MSVSPYSGKLTAELPAAAQGASSYALCEPAPYAGVVQSVTLVPMADITGANTNSRTFNCFNRTRSKTIATRAMTSGVNGTDNTALSLTLSSTADDLVVNAGDVLEVESLFVGSGLAAPACKAVVKIARS